MADGKITIEALLEQKGFDKGLKSMEKNLDSAAKGFDKTGKAMSVAITAPVTAAVGFATKSAMELENTEAKYNTVFGSMADTMDKHGEELMQLSAMTTTEYRIMASSTADLLKPMGATEEQAAQMTMEFMDLTGALQSFNGHLTMEEVHQKFQSAMLGNYDSLASLGIQTNKAEVQQKALQMGLADTVDELTDVDMQMALLEISTEKSSDAITAFTKENLSTQQELQLVVRDIKELGTELGAMFIPYVQMAVDKIRDLVDWFSGLDDQTKEAIVKFALVAAAVGPMLIGFGKLISIISSVITVVKGLTLAKMLLFGKIFLIIAVVILVILIFTVWKDKIMEIIDFIVNWIIEKIESFKEFWANVWEDIKELCVEIWESLKAIIIMIAEAIKEFIVAWLTFVKEFWTKVFNAIKDFTIKLFEKIKEIIISIAESIKAFIIAWLNFIKNFWTSVFNIIKTITTTIFNAIKTTIQTIMDIIKSIITSILNTIKSIWETIFNAMKTITSTVFNAIKTTISTVINSIKSVITSVMNTIKSTWDSIWNGMLSTVESIMSAITGAIKSGLNVGISLINGFIKAFNIPGKALSKIPGVKVPTIPEIPKLATGGIVSGETMAVVGDNRGASTGNPEVVAPLDKLQGILSATMSGMALGGTSEINVNVVNNVDERGITTMVTKNFDHTVRMMRPYGKLG